MKQSTEQARILKLIADRSTPVVKLDIGCGASKQGPEWIGIDFQPLHGVDIVHDIEVYPWPLPDKCIHLAVASHVAEHINPAKFGFVNWLNEVHRIMVPGGRFMLANPYAGSHGDYQDPTHINHINETTWTYFDPLHPNNFYRFYRPAPWKIISCSWDQQGFMETVLEARLRDKSYEA